ncbi:MAG: N(6)-L-threonylcarbamoyladenine synthase Kae1 [Candidatus Iainarchaeum archaeon]|uniref:tRNA N6-adenosine threonylcarbamoyltransferase n=1 Tax=Candidatus Iainarchaeum sp. TaxID=3101447 RepID=A0A7T9DK81_9ARCH|nr:MAG: N(6)-L-threonylcarbamoyladenine synthase Kae1 [Candidatus Diapherotrites archaeon]
MYALGIESTAHTFGIGIVDEKCNVLANSKAAYTHPDAGIHPRLAADHHLQHGNKVLEQALAQAKLSMKDIDVISFAQGPGLGPCLRVGAITARYLSSKYHNPLLGVNHCVAHVEIGKKKTPARDPIVVYTSGANTQIIGLENGKYRVFGETLDMGVGNVLDTFGRELGLGFPAGPIIDQRYFQGKNLIPLPYSVKGMDLVFAGLLTEAEKKIGKADEIDLCYSLMHTAFAMVCEVAERALAHTEKKEILVTGGVAASKALASMLEKLCAERGAKLFIVPREYAMDNGAMIAWQGMIEHRAGRKQPFAETDVDQRYRTDQVDVFWK